MIDFLNLRKISTGLLGIAFLLASALPIIAAEVYVITEGEHSGPSRVLIEGESIQSITPLAADTPVKDPFKAAVSQDGKFLLMGAGDKDQPQVINYPLDGTAPHVIPLNANVSDLAAAGSGFVVAASRGRFYWIDPIADPGSAVEWRARRELDPPGRKGEYICALPDQNLVLVSFQKDNDDSPALGNRMVVFGLDPLAAKHDLQLPRDRPELHIEDNPKEQGPSPEIVVASPRTNTVALTLDLYGALAMADLDAALAGNWKNLEYVSTAEDGSWGVAFPDRAALIPTEATDLVLVSNASENGGFALFDLGQRKKLGHLPAETGGETPVWLPATGKAVSALSGKVKARPTEGIDLSNERHPVPKVLFFDFANPDSNGLPALSSLDIGASPVRIAPAGEKLVLVFVENSDGIGEAVLIDAEKEEIIERRNLPGTPVRVARMPATDPKQE